MKKIALFVSFALLTILAGCSKELAGGPADMAQPVQPAVLDEANVPQGAVPGVLLVKFDDVPQGLAEIRSRLPQLNITSAERYFPDDPRYPKRIKASGLDRWYLITFDKWALMTKAARIAFDCEKVEHIDYVLKPQSNSLPFNDPLLGKQWHYYNDGTMTYHFSGRHAVAGADINLFDAWLTQTGSDDVIVAVDDSAVEYTHEDLADNIWINEAEYYGLPDVDDDGNGYVDDIYGYNFCTNDGSSAIGTLVPELHGTHIGGTIAAVNNNGIGVCGIAGGDGTHKGVRLMSAQTNQENTMGAYIGKSFYYAANNGAVVINCSWGIPSGPSASITDGINYFIQNAGMDDDGNQVGPIAGGVVCCSAGNENSTTEGVYPADLEGVIAVTAFGPDMERAYYSNYGTWADIAAPGGDYNAFGDLGCIVSTNLMAYGAYTNLQGTSMACPHVAGVAALVISQFKGPGTTAQMVKDILLASANPDIYDYNPGMRDGLMLGVGRLDAAAAVNFSADPPMPVTEFKEPVVKGNSATFEFKVPAHAAGTPDAKYVEIVLSAADGQKTADVDVSSKLGEWVSCTVEDLKFSTTYTAYYVSMGAAGGKSAPSDEFTFTTDINTPPVITPLDGTKLTLKAFEKAALRFKVYDAEEHDIYVSLVGETKGVSVKPTADDEATVYFNALLMEPGSYVVTLVAKDTYDASSSVDISYTVKENNPPVVAKSFDNLVLNSSSESKTFDLTEYFNDPDGEPLNYTAVASSVSKIAELSVDGNNLTVKGNWYGYTPIEVTASDAKGASVKQTFQVLVRDGSQEVDLYPIPVKTILNVRTGSKESGTLTVFNATGSKVFDKEVAFDPFQPATVDFSDLPSGIYSVVVKTGSKEMKKNITKE